jgi:hypothetical protein
MPRKSTPAQQASRLATLLVGQVITAIELEETKLEVMTKVATLTVTPTRFENLSATLGVMETVKLDDAEAISFMAGRQIHQATRNKSATTLFFTTGEELIIDAAPDVEFDSRPVYTVTRIKEEELING